MTDRRALRSSAIVVVSLVLAGAVAVAWAQDVPPVFRDGVELFVIRVHVTAPLDQAIPDLDVEDFTVRIGSRRSPALHAEHVAIPPEEERQSGPFAFFKPVSNRISALYLLGISPDAADCRQVPRVSVSPRHLRVRGVAWTPKPGCVPPGAKIIQR